jgi:sugar/nucleoside kinase (ribokinase family)
MMADAENEPPTFLPPGSTMHKGLFLGLSTADIVYYLPHHPLNNQKLKAERQMSFAGGPATNAAVAFAAFGNQATLVSGLGRHPLAHVPKMDLADQQVHLIDCSDQPRRPPILASILVDLSTGERSVVYSNTDLRKLRGDAVNESLLEDTDILMLDGYFLPQAVQLAGWARPLEKEGLDELLPLVDYAICSDDFYPPGCTDKNQVIDYLRSRGLTRIAITRDGNPILAHEDGTTVEVPVMPVQAMDTLGAGDILHGAFCHYILEQDFLLSLERAAEVASLSCTSLGTRAWIARERFA